MCTYVHETVLDNDFLHRVIRKITYGLKECHKCSESFLILPEHYKRIHMKSISQNNSN